MRNNDINQTFDYCKGKMYEISKVPSDRFNKPKQKEINPTYLMLGIGLLLQIITYIITKDSFLSFFSGITGVFAVVFCSERKMSTYVFSFLQMFTFTYICWNEQIYGKLIENLFYFITMVGGLFIWKNNLNNNDKVKTKEMTYWQFERMLCLMVIVIFFAYFGLKAFGSTAPLYDSSTTVIGIFAQILMITRYKENWILWFIQDIICIAMWINIGNGCMVAQYIFWTINCVYGYFIWRKNE